MHLWANSKRYYNDKWRKNETFHVKSFNLVPISCSTISDLLLDLFTSSPYSQMEKCKILGLNSQQILSYSQSKKGAWHLLSEQNWHSRDFLWFWQAISSLIIKREPSNLQCPSSVTQITGNWLWMLSVSVHWFLEIFQNCLNMYAPMMRWPIHVTKNPSKHNDTTEILILSENRLLLLSQ